MTRRFILFSLIVLAGTLYIGHSAMADEMLFVSPTRVELDSNNPRGKIVVLSVHNKDKIRRVYKLEASDMVMDEKGTTHAKDSFDYSASRMVRFFPRRIDMAPDARQKVRVQLSLRGNVPDGDYHTHLFFNEITTEVKQQEAEKGGEKLEDDKSGAKESTIEMAAALEFSVGIPVRVTVGNVKTKIALVGSSFQKLNEERGELVLNYTREGNGEGMGYVDIFHTDANGKREQLVNKNRVRIYRERDSIAKPYPIDLNKYPAGTLSAVLYTDADAGANDTTRIIGTATASIQ